MNLVGTLGKLLLSGALSKGGAGAGGLGSLLGGAGGLGELLGQLQGQQGGASQAGARQTSGAGDLLGSLLGGGQSGGGAGLGGLLGSALGQQMPTAQATPAATPEQSDHAALLIKAMVNAAKADGTVDAQEQEKIVGKLGDIGPEEAQFIRSEMQAPLNVAEFINSVPRGMEQQVYVLSLMTVNLDSKAEADYLDQLAKGFGLSENDSNKIHAQLGVPELYT